MENQHASSLKHSQLEILKPKTKKTVMELVRDAGVDVSNWKNFKGGKKRAASNPKYCYEWAFVEPNKTIVLNIWHAQLREIDGAIKVIFNHRRKSTLSNPSAKGISNARSKKFDEAIQFAITHNLPIRAIINEGKMRDKNDKNSKASSVKFRFLDKEPWSIDSYDWNTGESILVRGEITGKYVDQFSIPEVVDSPPERKDISGSGFVRNPKYRRIALERAKGKCEYCLEKGFTSTKGEIYLETHHVIALGDGGSDNERNVVAICPNHHREAHHGTNADNIRQELQLKLSKLFIK